MREAHGSKSKSWVCFHSFLSWTSCGTGLGCKSLKSKAPRRSRGRKQRQLVAGKQLLADLFVREQSQIGKLPEAEGLARDSMHMPHRVQVFPSVFMLMVLVIHSPLYTKPSNPHIVFSPLSHLRLVSHKTS